MYAQTITTIQEIEHIVLAGGKRLRLDRLTEESVTRIWRTLIILFND